MSLTLKIGKFCTANNCRTIKFSDGSGLYNATSNPTGWGNPNLTLGAVTDTHIYITLPDGTTTVDIEDPVGLPDDDTAFEYEIDAADLDSARTTIQDGLYQVEYTVTDGTTLYTTGKKYYLLTCNSECCVGKLFARIATLDDCACDSTIIKNALYANALLKGMEANKNCGDRDAIENILEKLNKICNSTGEDCGCS